MLFRRRNLLGIVFLLSLVIPAALGIWSWSWEPRADGKSIRYWIQHIRIGVKVLHNPRPDGAFIVAPFTVMLSNLNDEELASLIISTNVRTIERNTASTRVFPNSPDQVGLWAADELEKDSAGLVIRTMGTRALPYLIVGLHRHQSWVEDRFCRWVWPRLPESFQQRIGVPMHATHLRANSAYALGLLGRTALPAVPELQDLLKNDEDYMVRSVAREALQRINSDLGGRFYPELFRQTQTDLRVLPNGNTSSSNLFSLRLSL